MATKTKLTKPTAATLSLGSDIANYVALGAAMYPAVNELITLFRAKRRNVKKILAVVGSLSYAVSAAFKGKITLTVDTEAKSLIISF
jgi:hypothetical protein